MGSKISWVMLAVVGALVLLVSLISANLAYRGDFPVGGVSIGEIASGRDAVLLGLRGARGTAAAWDPRRTADGFRQLADYGQGIGVKVLIDDGRRSQRYFQFVAEGGQLKLWVDGQAHGPEAFARAVLEPWLRALPLHGR